VNALAALSRLSLRARLLIGILLGQGAFLLLVIDLVAGIAA